MRLIIAILLLAPVLVGTYCPCASSAEASRDADATAVTAADCCGRASDDAESERHDEHQGCGAGCLTCCKVPLLVDAAIPCGHRLASAERSPALPELVVATERTGTPLRPPRNLS